MIFVSRRLPKLSRRRALGAAALLAAQQLVVACSKGPGASSDPPPKPALTFSPADGASGTVPTVPISIGVKDGWFQHIALTSPAGKTVAGIMNRERTAFAITEPDAGTPSRSKSAWLVTRLGSVRTPCTSTGTPWRCNSSARSGVRLPWRRAPL